jgi:hypothetical protein
MKLRATRWVIVLCSAIASACSDSASGDDDTGSTDPLCRTYATQYRVTSDEGSELGTCDFDEPSLTMTCRRYGNVIYDVLTTWDSIDAAVRDNQPIGFATRASDTIVLTSDCSVVHDYVYDSSDRLTATEASTTGDSCGGPSIAYDAWDEEGRPTHGTTNGVGVLDCMGQNLQFSYDDATLSVTAAYSGGTDCRDETIGITYDADGIVVSTSYSIDGGATAVVSTFTTAGRAEICTD